MLTPKVIINQESKKAKFVKFNLADNIDKSNCDSDDQSKSKIKIMKEHFKVHNKKML